ncbi:MAG TPA: tetratricopeptide repeat protein [Thermoanaerobaculia bacterium]|nr:tetratricopeptide repeat protein [Thermoanaerobaculia bacterium]
MIGVQAGLPPRARAAEAQVALAVLLAAFSAVAFAELPPLVEVPRPQLQGVEPAVEQQLTEVRGRLEELRARPDVDPRELGARFAEMGQIYLVYDLTDAAAAALENASRLQPGEHRWPYLLGTLHEHDRRLADAAHWYEAAKAANPTYLPTLLRLGDVRLLEGDPVTARALYQQALALAPDDAYTHAALGRAAARERRHAEAARHFERALELDPQATSLHYPAAQAYRAAGEEEAMRRHLDSSGSGRVRFADPVAEEVQRQVRGAGAELLLARMAMREGAVDVAETRVRRALELDPTNPSAYNNLAVVLEATGRTDEAVEAYSEAARLDPDSVGRRFTLARLLERLGRDEEAAGHLRQVLRLAPDFAEGRTELARILTRQGRLEEAALEYREVLAADARATTTRFELVEVLERLGAAAEARRELELVLEGAPRFAPAQFKMGSVLAEAGDYAGAIERFERAADIDPDLVEAHQNLAILHGRRGDFAAAARHQERAIDLGPETAEARLTLATARILGGELEAARRGLEEALALHPSDPRIADTLARVLAAAPDDAVRDGAAAAEIASKLLEAAPSAQHAETLAMALAELGRYAEAAKLQERVVAGIESSGGEAPGLLDGARRRLEQYRRGEPARAPWLER